MDTQNESEKPNTLELAYGIAASLNGTFSQGWKARGDDEDRRDWRAWIDGPGGAELFISNTWADKGRLYIGGHFPGNYRPRGEDHSITVSEKKSPQQIAKDITGRLLPEYLPALAKALEGKRRDEEFQAGKESSYRAAANLFGLSPRDPGNGNSDNLYLYLYTGPGSAQIFVNGPDSYTVKVGSLTLAQLRALKAALPEAFTAAKS